MRDELARLADTHDPRSPDNKTLVWSLREIDRLYARLSEATQILRRCKATCSPARVEEIDGFLESLAKDSQ